jgi:hypothetical protein
MRVCQLRILSGIILKNNALAAIDPVRLSAGLDILYPFLYRMTIVAPLFWLLIDTKVPDRATVKHPPSISSANLFATCLGGKRV